MIAVVACAALALATASGARADAWSGPETAIPNGGTAMSAAMGPDGTALAAGYRAANNHLTLSLAERAPSGRWAKAQRFSVPGASEVISAMGDGGAAIVASNPSVPYGAPEVVPDVFVRDPGQARFAPSPLPAFVSPTDEPPLSGWGGSWVAMTAGGTALLTWMQLATIPEGNGALEANLVYAATRVPGGGWVDQGPVATNPLVSSGPVVADDGTGTMMAFGTSSIPGLTAPPMIVVRELNADGSLGPPRSIVVGAAPSTDRLVTTSPLAIAVAPDGSVHVAYRMVDISQTSFDTQTLGVARFGADGTVTNDVLDTAGGQAGVPTGGGAPGTSLDSASIGFDGAGAASVAWSKTTRRSGVPTLAATQPAAGQPFAAPQVVATDLSTFTSSLPAVEPLGDGRLMLLSADDDGVVATIRGPGQTAFRRSSKVVVKSAQVPAGTLAGDGHGQVLVLSDTSVNRTFSTTAYFFDRNAKPAPALSRLSVKPRRFAVRARVSWRLSQAEKTTFIVERDRHGVYVQGHCRPVRHRARHARRCKRVQVVERFVHRHGRAGMNHLVLRVRWRHHRRLHAGHYVLEATTSQARKRGAGTSGAVPFRVLARRHRHHHRTHHRRRHHGGHHRHALPSGLPAR